MKNILSSVFEFKTLKSFPRPTATFLLTPFFLFLIVFFIWEKGIDMKRVELACEFGGHAPLLGQTILKKNIKDKNDYAPLLLAGSSLSARGFLRTVFNQRFSMNVDKASMADANPWIMLRMFKRYPIALDGVKILVVNCDERQFILGPNININVKTGRYKYIRNWYDILPPTGRSNEWSDPIADYLLPARYTIRDIYDKTNQARRNEREILDYIKANGTYKTRYENKVPEPSFLTKKLVIPWESIAKLEAEFGLEQTIVANWKKQMADFSQVNRYLEKQWIELFDYCRSKDVIIVFVVSPFRDSVREYMKSSQPEIEQDFRAIIERFKKRTDIVVIDREEYQDLIRGEPNFIDTTFIDYGHMFPEGAEVYSNWLCDRLLSNEKICKHLGIPMDPEPKTDMDAAIKKVLDVKKIRPLEYNIAGIKRRKANQQKRLAAQTAQSPQTDRADPAPVKEAELKTAPKR